MEICNWVNKRVFIASILFLFFGRATGQDFGNHRIREFAISSDTTIIDTLSIIPGTFRFLSSVDSANFSINHARAILIYQGEGLQRPQLLKIEYRVFPLLLERDFYHKDYQTFLSPDSLMGREVVYRIPRSTSEQVFGDNIRTSGSFTRGISVGNNQDVSVNSGMNIRLNGELGAGLMIEGAISDQNIPLQPQGNTRRLEEFDRIYMKVYKENFSIQAGDIDMVSRDKNSLLSFSRSVQGLGYKGFVGKKGSNDTLLVEATASVAKGKFARNQIQGVEGNQGPYRLNGANGEPFIIIISGSERVFVDGVLLTRGEDAHYVIDYNAAEVTFTPSVIISLNSRIVVEFEYSERSYARFNTHASVQHLGKKWDWRFSAFSEVDAKNQPYDQDLTDQQKQLLASIGDRINEAYISQIDSVDFNPEIILYQKVDTVVNEFSYSIFQHSTNSQAAHFKVVFSYVGEGNGNYVVDFGSANGRVYRWVAPSGANLQGNYEPVRRLVVPAKRQMVTGGVGRKWRNDSGIQMDYALSNTDLNTFSSFDSEDDIGHALKASFVQRFQKSDSSASWAVGGDLLKTSNQFRTIDRFREVEFERNWSINAPLAGGGEQQVGTWLQFIIPKKTSARVNIETLKLENGFSGNKGSFRGWQQFSDFRIAWDGFLVNSSDSLSKTNFSKGRISIEKPFWFINLGVISELEHRNSLAVQVDTLMPNSFQWYSLKAYISTPDTLNERATVSYTFRSDYLPLNQQIVRSSESHDVMLNSFIENQNIGNISFSVGNRIFNPITLQLPITQKEERTFLGKFEYSKRFWKGLWFFSSGYELGSGLEPAHEYYFVEVPAGQGLFAWVDYNGNEIKELDEFEIARFSDEAKYIRINIMGTKTVRVKTNAFTVRSNINPNAIIKQTKGFRGFVRKFSNQSSYMVRQKNRFEDFWPSANPFSVNIMDTLITSSSASYRNSLALNRSSRKIGAEYLFSGSKTKAMLAYGFEHREVASHRLLTWIGLGSQFTLKMEGEKFNNSATSKYFQNRNYTIDGIEPKVGLRYFNTKNLTVEAIYQWTNSENLLGSETATIQGLSLQIDLSFLAKGSVMAKVNLVENKYTGNTDSPVAYEMLKGLQSGRNWVWETQARRRLSNYFELELG